MKEFMLLIRNEIGHQDTWPAERHREFLEQCESYIGTLKRDGKLISAQPLIREGAMVTRRDGRWTQGAFTDTKETIVGYYHIRAASIDEAITIAQGNPEFSFGSAARVEVRPVKTREETTGFRYPE